MTQKKKKRSTISFKDIQIAYLCSGIEHIEELYQKRLASPNTIRKALHQLKHNGSAVEPLEHWFRNNFGLGLRGRAAPRPGQERVYRAQKIKTTGTFLRLPLSALSIDKGESVSVTFEKDRIVIKRV